MPKKKTLVLTTAALVLGCGAVVATEEPIILSDSALDTVHAGRNYDFDARLANIEALLKEANIPKTEVAAATAGAELEEVLAQLANLLAVLVSRLPTLTPTTTKTATAGNLTSSPTTATQIVFPGGVILSNGMEPVTQPVTQ